MKRSFFLSLLLHSMLFASLGIGFLIHKKRGIEIPNDTAIIVNFTKIGPRSQAPIIGQPSSPPPSQEQPKKQEPKKEIPAPKRKEQKKAVPEKGDIAKKEKAKKKEKDTKQEAKGKKKQKEENKLDKKTAQDLKGKASSSSNTKNPIKLGPEDAQRADEFGLEIVTTEAALIKAKIDKYWAPPEIAENSGVKIRVFIEINYETGRIKNYHVVDRTGPSEYYLIFENRIAFVLNNPEIDFLDLTDETRKLLSERGLEIIFDADTNNEG